MPRLRNVGKQAAGANDILSKRDLDAFDATLPSLYVQRSLFNQPNGVAQLDANSRIGNTYLPTDIARTTLTASGKVKGGSLEVVGAGTVGTSLGVTGALTAGSAGIGGNATVGGTLAVTGALTAPSIDVGTGQVKGLTGDIPEITSANFKAKATTLDSLKVTGVTNIAALNMTGDISTQAISAVAATLSGGMTAGAEVSAPTLHATGSLIADGATSLQALTVAGIATVAALNASGQIKANAGLRVGVSQTISQVDGSNNGVPVAFANGINAGGAISGVTTLTTTGAAQIGGTITATGKGTFSDLQSNSNLSIAGTISGVTDLSIIGNLNVQGTGKRITTTEVATGILGVTGQTTLSGPTTISGAASLTGSVALTNPLSVPVATADTHAPRRVQVRSRMNERFASAKPTIAHNVWTDISFNSWGLNDPSTLTGSGTNLTVQRTGLWIVAGHTKFDYRENNGTRVVAVTVDGNRVAHNDTTSYDGFLSCARMVYLTAGQVVRMQLFHFTGSNLQTEAGVHGTCLTMVWMGEG